MSPTKTALIWTDVFNGMLVGFVTALGIMAIAAVTADHSPRYYYIDWHKEDRAPMPCVEAYREWSTNQTAFCSQDIDKVTTMLDHLNDSLLKRKALEHR